MPAGMSATAAAAREARCPIRCRLMGPAPSAVSMAASRPDTTTCFRPDFWSASRATFRFRSSSRMALFHGGRRRSTARSGIRSITSRRCARASATSSAMRWSMPPAVSPRRRRVSLRTPARFFPRTRWFASTSAGRPALAPSSRSRRTGLRGSNISTTVSMARRRVSVRHCRGFRVSISTHVRLGLNHFFHPGEASASAPRSDGNGEPVADRAGELERARPVHADRAGLSELPLAIPGPEQPGGVAPDSRTPRARPHSSASGCGTAWSSTSIPS